jgi:hypothetical protein
LPFYFKLYNHEVIGNEVISRIEKKSHFSKKTEIIENNSILSAQEKVFLEMAKELNNNHYYFAKWTSFPIFVRKEGIFSIKFFFMETMMRTRNMFIQYDFDVDTQTFIGADQGSGHIQLTN